MKNSSFFNIVKFFALPLIFIGAFECLHAEEIDAEKMNSALGAEIFTDDNIFDDSPKEVLQRFGLKFTFAKAGDKYNATALKAAKEFFGIKAEEVNLTFDEKNVYSINIIFFNKGDSLDKNDNMSSADSTQMRKDANKIAEKLDELLGKSQTTRIGSGKLATNAKSWEFGENLFLLDFKHKEYVILRMRPKSDDVSKKEYANSKKDWSENLKSEENGDTYIENIPMVNQGEKGYCVPAALERCLRYYKIENVDMHKIAEVCKSGSGGGTTISGIMKDFKSAAIAYRLKIADCPLTMNGIKKSIDDGAPVCWLMFSPPDYIRRMMANTKQRKDSTQEEWIKVMRKQKKLSKDNKSGHICLIIGYNMKTKELAVSNTWGEQFAITWIRFDDAKAMNISTFAIKPR